MRKKENLLLFEFLQVAIGIRKSLSVSIDDGDWLRLFDFCKKQALIGVGFTAVEKLHIVGVICPAGLRMQWMALALQIEKKNSLLNEQCSQLARNFEHDGLSTCILKGQGNCLNYPEGLSARRMPGDIDVWATPISDEGSKIKDKGIAIAVQTGKEEVEYVEYHGRKAVIEYVRMQFRLQGIDENPKACYHHIEAPSMAGTEVEVHYRPAFLRSPLRNWRMQRWFEHHADECMKNKTHLGFSMMTSSVNVVYQICHLYTHIFEGGIGLRQLMDYYFALRVWHNDVMECKDLQSQGMWSEGLGTPVMSKEEVMAVLRSFGMGKFAGAVMFVLHKVFENEECRMKKQRSAAEGKANEECSEADDVVERELTQIKRELKEIGPQADDMGEQQLSSMGQQFKENIVCEPWLLCEPNEKEGKKLLEEIMKGGNFGQYDERGKEFKNGGMVKHGLWKLKRVMRLVRSYPEEALWEPMFRVYHLIWRLIH